MNEDFDFKQIGKRMPYQVPDDFFDDVSGKVIAEYERRNARKATFVRLRRWVSAVAAVVVLGGGIWFAFYENKMDSTLAYNLRMKDSSIGSMQTAKDSKTPQPKEQRTATLSKRDKATQPGKPIQQKQQTVKTEKPASLDDDLKSLSKEELEHLSTFSENDFIDEE